MNYQNFAPFNNIFSKGTYSNGTFHNMNAKNIYDNGSGINLLNTNNTTIQDIYKTPFLYLQEHPENFKYMNTQVTNALQQNGELRKMFFSDENICRIQKMIKKQVYIRSNKKFKLDVDQDLQDLYIVMNSVFIEHAKYIPNNIVRQVKKLNNIVIDTVIPGMFSKIKQQYTYLREINKPISPIDLPVNASTKGRRTLPSITNILGIY